MKKLVEISRICSYLSLGCLFALALIISCGVIARYIFKQPIRGIEDITELLMIIQIFSAIAFTQVKRGHVVIEIVISRLTKYRQAVLNFVMYFVSGVFFIIVALQLGKRAWLLCFTPVKAGTASLNIPYGPFIFFAAFGCILLSMILLIDSYDSLLLMREHRLKTISLGRGE